MGFPLQEAAIKTPPNFEILQICYNWGTETPSSLRQVDQNTTHSSALVVSLPLTFQPPIFPIYLTVLMSISSVRSSNTSDPHADSILGTPSDVQELLFFSLSHSKVAHF